MEAGGGAAHPEAPSGEGARLQQSQSQMQLDGPVVLNRCAELESSDAMDIDATPAQAPSQMVPPTQSPAATLTDTIVQVQKQLKRKRASNGPVIAPAEKESLAAGCRQELEGLFEYFKEVSGHKMQLDGGGNLSTNAMIGCLLEESNLGLSKLVDETFEKLKGTEGVSVASVRSSVLLIGQRMMYGQSSPDADVLEDESELSLWCWEVNPILCCSFTSWCHNNSFQCYFNPERPVQFKLICLDVLWWVVIAGKRFEGTACENAWVFKCTENCQEENP